MSATRARKTTAASHAALSAAAIGAAALAGSAAADTVEHFGAGPNDGPFGDVPSLLDFVGIGSGNSGAETTDEFFGVPGPAGSDTDLTFTFQRDTGTLQYTFGFFPLSAVTGLDPIADPQGYATAAIGAATQVFDDAGTPDGTVGGAPMSGPFTLPAGSTIGFFIIPNASIADFLADPGAFFPPNRTELEPLFSESDANPGQFDQMLSFIGNDVTLFTFEDRTRDDEGRQPSDEDYTDLAFTIDLELGPPPPPPPPNGNPCFEPEENNDECVGAFADQTIDVIGEDCRFIPGKLEKRFDPGLQPDTFLCVFDKQDNIIASNDNRDEEGKGNPWASAIWSVDGDDEDDIADVLVANGDGTYSLRLVVTGYPDGVDGNCNGFFQNAPHGQLGEFELCVRFVDSGEPAQEGGSRDPDIVYRDEFRSGSEAFRLNFTAPPAAEVHIQIDNTVGRVPVCRDRDYMCFTGFDPLEEVFISIVGGLDENCEPTDTELCWLDKDCNVIDSDDNSGPVEGYSQLFTIADTNGNICIKVSGGGDDDCDGFVEVEGEGTDDDGGPVLEPHGVCGNYVVKITRASEIPPREDEAAAMEQVMGGDLNQDGGVDARDLGILLVNWGRIF